MDNEQSAFKKLFDRVLKDLRKSQGGGAVFDVLRKYQREMDRAYETAPLSDRSQVACCAGCSACCYTVLGVQAHEVLLVAEFLKTQPEPVRLAATESAARHVEVVRRGSEKEYFAARLACPMLQDGKCSCYEVRPEVCRAHHSNNSALCGDVDLERSDRPKPHYIFGLRTRMFAFMGAIDHAVANYGLDGRQYYFAAALHEALTDTGCLERWKNKQQTFSDSCREIDNSGNFTPEFKPLSPVAALLPRSGSRIL